MARLTIVFGFLLVVIAVIGFVLTGHSHYTSLIPALFGLILIVCGAAANTPIDKRRMLYMHIAVTVGLIGFLSTALYLWKYVQLLQGVVFEHPVAVEEKAAMAAVCLLFTLLCVRSFISARRARRA